MGIKRAPRTTMTRRVIPRILRRKRVQRFCTKTLLCRLADGHRNGCERI